MDSGKSLAPGHQPSGRTGATIFSRRSPINLDVPSLPFSQADLRSIKNSRCHHPSQNALSSRTQTVPVKHQLRPAPLAPPSASCLPGSDSPRPRTGAPGSQVHARSSGALAKGGCPRRIRHTVSLRGVSLSSCSFLSLGLRRPLCISLSLEGATRAAPHSGGHPPSSGRVFPPQRSNPRTAGLSSFPSALPSRRSPPPTAHRRPGFPGPVAVPSCGTVRSSPAS